MREVRPHVASAASRMHRRAAIPITLMFLAVLLLDACSRPKGNPASRVANALQAANLHGIDVEFDVASSRLRLMGTVTSRSERNRALDVAMDAIGTSVATFSNELAVREPVTAAITTDDRIRRQLLHDLDQDRVLQRRGIGVTVHAGVVTLTGHVATMSEKRRARTMASAVVDVTDVIDRLAVKPTTAPPRP